MKKGLLITALVILGIGAAGVGIGLALTKGNFKAFDRHEYVTNEVEFEGEITNLKIDEHVSALEIVETEETKTKIVLKEIAHHKHTVTLNEGTLSISEADWNLGFFDWFKYGPILNEVKTTVYLPVKEYNEWKISDNTGAIKIDGAYNVTNFKAEVNTGAAMVKDVIAKDAIVKCDTGSLMMSGGKYDTLTVENNTGSISISDLTSAYLSVSEDTGSLKISKISGCNTLKTENDTGSTRIEDVVASNLIDSESDTGSITLVACDAPTINLRNGTGSIRAELLSGKSYNVKSSTGSINVPDNYPEGGSLTAKTSTGSIRITVK
jgi:DUF4097 and DUF4098 domain-containing protein YvlB